MYLQSHVRTRRWFDDGKVYTWKDGEENGKARYGVPKTGRKETTWWNKLQKPWGTQGAEGRSPSKPTRARLGLTRGHEGSFEEQAFDTLSIYPNREVKAFLEGLLG